MDGLKVLKYLPLLWRISNDYS